MLFGAFGQTKDVDRMKIYVKTLSTMPEQLVEKAILKTITEWTYSSVPPVAVVINNAKSLIGAVDETHRVKTWDEAWQEIERAMYATPWGKTPKWSTPQIAAAVNAIGWNEIQTVETRNLNTMRAQVRQCYESACARMNDQAKNEYLIGKNPMGVLGIPMPVAIKQIGE